VVLVQEIGDAERHGLEIQLEGSAAREHDDRRPGASIVGGADQLETIAIGQGGIDDADIECRVPQAHHAGLQVTCAVDGKADMRRGVEQVPGLQIVLLDLLDQQDPNRAAPRLRPSPGDVRIERAIATARLTDWRRTRLPRHKMASVPWLRRHSRAGRDKPAACFSRKGRPMQNR
jgi:hypothetical protein